MKERPREFKVLAVLLAAIALSFPIQLLLMGYEPVPENFAPLNWAVLVLAVMNCAAVYLASPWVFLTAPAFIGAVLWNNYLVAQVGLNVSALAAVIAAFAVIVMHGALLTERARRVLFNPSLRWWRTPLRKKTQLRAFVTPVLGGKLTAMTHDLSTGGAFISMTNSTWASAGAPASKRLETGARISVRIILDQLHVVSCSGVVVRHSAPRGNYPGGFAVRFIGLEDEQKRVLTEFLSRQAPTGAPVSAAA